MVKQEDSMGCAIACVAFILNETYQVSKYLFEFPEHAKTIGFWPNEIIAVLAKKNKKYNYYEGNCNIPVGAIVFVSRCEYYKNGHYLVKTEDGWMDSWEGRIIEDLHGPIEIVLYEV